MNDKSGLQQKGHFSHPGQRGWCLSTTRALSVHVPGWHLHITRTQTHVFGWWTYFFVSGPCVDVLIYRNLMAPPGPQLSVRMRRFGSSAFSPLHLLVNTWMSVKQQITFWDEHHCCINLTDCRPNWKFSGNTHDACSAVARWCWKKSRRKQH